MHDCDCNEEYGPCEQHGRVLAQREGAAVRTADDLTMVLISDLISCDANLSAEQHAAFRRLDAQLEQDRDSYTGCAWFKNPDDADEAVMLAQDAELVTDAWVFHDDGYVIVQLSDDCPLLEG